VSIGPRRRPCHYHLRSPIRSEQTLAAFHRASNIWRKRNSKESFSVTLPRVEASVFGKVIEWMNHEPLGTFDDEEYDELTHVSEWLVLHILALKFCVPDLAAEALLKYKSCRNPHWEGLWLPLPTEILYISHNDEYSTKVEGVVVSHIMSQCFSHRCAGNLGKIAVLLGCHENFTLAVLRAIRDHMSETVEAAQSCGVDGCIHHPQHLSQADIEDENRPPSDDGFSDFTEIIIRTPTNAITKDDEDAMEAAEVLEALSEMETYYDIGAQ
jgi:hypothetical protein